MQGGIYSCPATAELVQWLRGRGVRGVGQSSWGPTVFAMAGDADEATALIAAAHHRWGGKVRTVASAGRNVGASCVRAQENGSTPP